MAGYGQERTGLLGLLLPGDYPGTTLMQLFCVGFFLLQMLQGQSFMDFDGYLLLRDGANVAELSLSGAEPWRLITYAFLHGGAIHLGFNLYVLWILGKLVESRFGTSRFLILYVVSAFAGGLASAVWGGGMSVGASGAVTGAMGAGIVASHMAGTSRGLAVRNQLLMWVWINALLGLSMGAGGGARVDNWAHLGGILAGGALGYIYVRFDRPWRKARRIEAVIATILTVGAVGATVGHQIYVRDVPVISDWSPHNQSIVAGRLWEECAVAIDRGDLEEALPSCRTYRYTVSFNSAAVQLTESLYEVLGQDRAARREMRLLRALLGDRPIPLESQSPRQRVLLLRQAIAASGH